MAKRNHISILLAFSMLFSIFFLAATPPAEAGLFRCLAKVGRIAAVAAAATTGALIGCVVGMVTGSVVGCVAGLAAGAILAGTTMAAITSTTTSSALGGAAIGAFYGCGGGPIGVAVGAVVGGLVGGAIGLGADDSNFDCCHGKKGGVVASGYIKGADQSPKTGITETADPAPGQRDEPEESLPTDFPEETPSEAPEIPAAEDASGDSSPVASESDNGGDDIYIVTPEEMGEDMGVEAAVHFLVMQESELDNERAAVLASKNDAEQYESMLDQRELIASSLTRKLIAEAEANNGRPGEAFSQFKANVQKLEPQKRAALNDVIKAVKDNAVHNQVNNPGSNGFKSFASELDRM